MPAWFPERKEGLITTTHHILRRAPALGLFGLRAFEPGRWMGNQLSPPRRRSVACRPLLTSCVSMELLVGINALVVARLKKGNNMPPQKLSADYDPHVSITDFSMVEQLGDTALLGNWFVFLKADWLK